MSTALKSKKGISSDQVAKALADSGGNIRAAARALGVDPGTIRWHYSKSKLYTQRDILGGEATIAIEPTVDTPIEDIIARLDDEHDRKRDASEHYALTPINFKSDAPIGISIIGDTHVDDGGSDRKLLTEHLDIINDTPGLYAGHIGDVGNSWGAKLRHLYSEQSTKAKETIRLIEYYIKYCRKWLFIVEGNHDRWANEYDPNRGFMPDLSSKVYRTTCSLAFQFPNECEVTMLAKHTFRGRSIYNVCHGLNAAASRGFRYNILAAGHIHTAGINMLKDPNRLSGLDGGRHTHCLQVGTYKSLDRYAETGDFHDHNITPCWTAVIDPSATREVDLVTPIPSLNQAAKFLSAIRG